MVAVWEAGIAWFWVYAKVICCGLTVTLPPPPDEPPTTMLTATDCVAPEVANETVPLQVVPLGIPAGYTVTEMGVCTVPAYRLPAGVICSQL